MAISFTAHAWEDYTYWAEKMVKRINKLIDDTMSDPFKGIGKPEP